MCRYPCKDDIPVEHCDFPWPRLSPAGEEFGDMIPNLGF